MSNNVPLRSPFGGERFVTLVTAGLAMWNVGLAFVAGMAIYHMYKQNWLHL